jgi:predicted NUDIX family phosphoesterase
MEPWLMNTKTFAVHFPNFHAKHKLQQQQRVKEINWLANKFPKSDTMEKKISFFSSWSKIWLFLIMKL